MREGGNARYLLKSHSEKSSLLKRSANLGIEHGALHKVEHDQKLGKLNRSSETGAQVPHTKHKRTTITCNAQISFVGCF